MGKWSLREGIEVATVASFVCSVLYLLGFSTGVGVNLFPFFGLADYPRLALLWLPASLLTACLAFVVEGSLRRLERGLSEQEIVEGRPKPEATRRWRALPWQFTFVLVVLIGPISAVCYKLGLVPSEAMWSAWIMSGPALWWALLEWYMQAPRLSGGWTRQEFTLAFVVPAILLFSLFCGAARGAGSSSWFIPMNESQLFLRGRPQPLVGQVLYMVSDFVILRKVRDGQLVILPKSELTAVRPVAVR